MTLHLHHPPGHGADDRVMVLVPLAEWERLRTQFTEAQAQIARLISDFAETEVRLPPFLLRHEDTTP